MGDGSQLHRAVIVGGGFGGIRAALDLAKHPDTFDITLISDKPHFEYTPSLYRVVAGRSPLEVCIPLTTIFQNSEVKIVEDTVETVSPRNKQIVGSSQSRYRYDSLILALGSETAFYDVPGLKDHSFGLKSINDALLLKRHLHDLFTAAAEGAKVGGGQAIHLVLVGGGSTGVELSGELAIYCRQLAIKHRLRPNAIIIELFEESEQILPNLPEKVSRVAEQRLRQLDINIFLATPILAKKLEAVYLAEMKIKTKTVIWTAGVKTNSFYQKIKGLQFNENGRVLADLSLEARGCRDIYVIGDALASQYAGTAQNALYDGSFVARSICRKMAGHQQLEYRPRKPVSALPIGPGWAIVQIGRTILTGRMGWYLRRLADLRFFLSILPPLNAWTAFASGQKLTETCPICSKTEPSSSDYVS